MRWLKFNAVGALGMAVQLGSLGVFVHGFGLHYLLATALAVEAAVLHNFLWHRRWTWADRPGIANPAWGLLLLRFNLTTGMVSIVGNLLFMGLLAGAARLDPLLANLLSIGLCSLVNFLVCDRFVFLPRPASDSVPRGNISRW
ncbi:MAG: GtrA family protein [Terriglobia bacterium]